jgi:hypothetical protein
MWILNFSQTYGPSRTVTGIAFLLFLLLRYCPGPGLKGLAYQYRECFRIIPGCGQSSLTDFVCCSWDAVAAVTPDKPRRNWEGIHYRQDVYRATSGSEVELKLWCRRNLMLVTFLCIQVSSTTYQYIYISCQMQSSVLNIPPNYVRAMKCL